MLINDSITSFMTGVNKVVDPLHTVHMAMDAFSAMPTPILEECREINRPSGIPQYICLGTDHYAKVVNRLGANGKGYSRDLAKASALMEMVERYSCYSFLQGESNRTIASFSNLHRPCLTPADLFLNVLDERYSRILQNSEIQDTPLGFYRAYDLQGAAVYWPANFVSHSLEITNGMAAGNSIEEAICHGVCEVIERHCSALVERNQLVTPTIDRASVVDPLLNRLLDSFRALSQTVVIKDLSLGTGIPVIGVARKVCDRYTLFSTGAAPSPTEALIRALTENSQKEPPQLTILDSYVGGLDYHFSDQHIVNFDHLPNIEHPNLKTELLEISRLLARVGMKIYYSDATAPELGIPAAIAFISGAKFEGGESADTTPLTSMVYELVRIGQQPESRRALAQLKQSHWDLGALYEGMLRVANSDYSTALTCFDSVLEASQLSKAQTIALVLTGLAQVALEKEDDAFRSFVELARRFPRFFYGPVNAKFKREFREITGRSDLLARADSLYARVNMVETLRAYKRRQLIEAAANL
jgi:ribosomal protein S12 methylthiotransferase accessory factor